MSFYLSPFFRFFLISLFFVLNTFSVSLLSQDINLGESLFKVNCASCHYLGPEEKKLIGPGLDNEIFEDRLEIGPSNIPCPETFPDRDVFNKGFKDDNDI